MFEQLFSATIGGTAVGGLAVTNVQLTDFLQPLVQTLITLAGLTAGFFVVVAGLEYMTSRGNPKRLNHAKQTLKNAALGLLLVIAAAFIFNFLNTAYNTAAPIGQGMPPPIIEVSEPPTEGLAGKILATASDFFRHIIVSTFDPVIDLIRYLSFKTPLAGSNPVVSKLWLTVLGIANSLFILATVLLGLRLMSASTFGFDELSFRRLLPKLGLIFLVMNSSLLLIDIVISISNAMLDALMAATGVGDPWLTWQALAENGAAASFVSLLLTVLFLILGFGLLIYYVLRLVIIYLGAVLAPLIVLMQLLPFTKGFTLAAIRTYFYTIFVLFIHAVILSLATGLLASLASDQIHDQGLLTLIIGIATLTLMLKTPKTLAKWCRVSYSFKPIKNLGGQIASELSQGLEHARAVRLANMAVEENTIAKGGDYLG